MRTIGYDVNAEKLRTVYPDSRIRYMGKGKALSQADFVSIHTGGIEVIVGERELSLMKPTAYLINASRAENVSSAALYNALKGGRIAGAGIDVHENEPAKDGEGFASRLAGLPNVVLTPHLGASTKEAQKRTSAEIAKAVAGYLLRGDFCSAVNAGETVEAEKKPTFQLFIYHRDVPGVFASIDRVLADSKINIRQNPSRVIGNDGNAVVVYTVHQKPTEDVMQRLSRLEMVYWVKG